MADFCWTHTRHIRLTRLEIGRAGFGVGPIATVKENAKRAIVVSLYGRFVIGLLRYVRPYIIRKTV